MLTEDKVKQMFLLDGDTIVLPNNAVVAVSKFAELFSQVGDNPSYDDFVAENKGKGYLSFFDSCKEKGLIN